MCHPFLLHENLDFWLVRQHGDIAWGLQDYGNSDNNILEITPTFNDVSKVMAVTVFIGNWVQKTITIWARKKDW